MKRYGVIGNPIKHSLSPLLHNYIYRELNINASYESILIETEEKLFKFLNNNLYDGLNITIPYKETILKNQYNVNSRANLIGSGNVVSYIDGAPIINNTDWFGFILALKENNINLNNKEVIIIGAGGVAKAVYFAIQSLDRMKIKIFNRTKSKAEDMINSHYSKTFQLDELDGHIKNDSVIINCTSIGLDDISSPISLDLISNNQIIIDVIYKVEKTSLINESIRKGSKVMDGIEMFIYQGLLSHELWFNENIIDKVNINEIKEYLQLNIC